MLYAFGFLKHPIQDLLRIYIKGCENGQTLATGCFKVTARLPFVVWWAVYLPAAAEYVCNMKGF